MDGCRFDELARAVGAESSRRQLLKGLAAGVVGALFGLSVGDDAGAAKCKRRGERCRQNNDCCNDLRCRDRVCERRNDGGGGSGGCRRNTDCPDDGNPCTASVCDGGTGECVRVDILNGTPCGESALCEQGICSACVFDDQGLRVCPDPVRPAGFSCVATNQDPTNCGSCGNVCDPGFRCCTGVCIEGEC